MPRKRGRVPSAVPRAGSAGGIPWKRIAVIGTVLAVVAGLVLVVLAPEPEPRLGLGAASAKDPVAARIVTTAEWGPAPADQILVLLEPGLARADAERIASQVGASVVGEVAFLSLYQLETQGRSGADLNGAIARARGVAGVAAALANQILLSKDAVGARCDPLGDPSYLKGSNARAYEMIGLRAAWDVLAASGLDLKDVKVGVLDSALYTPAGEFNGAVKATGDTTTTQFKGPNGSLEIGGFGHGTGVTHVIAANPDNGGAAGVAGVLGAKLKVDVSDIYRQGIRFVPQSSPDPKDPTLVVDGGQTYSMRTFADIVRQIDAGATVINASFGPVKPGPANQDIARVWRDFLKKMAIAHPKVLFVAAAGNENGALDGANYSIGGHPLPNLMTVGAVTNDGKRASFSNYAGGGDGEVSIAAPGEDVMLGIGPDGKPVVDSGTSFATPQVTGAAALLRSVNPDLTAAEIKKILIDSAAPGVLTKDAKGNEVSQLVPAAIGGRVLRVDAAILHVVNGMRAKRDPKLPALTLRSARDLAVIDVKGVPKEGLSWTVVAQLPGVGDKGADVRLDFSGQASVGGQSTQHLGAAGALQWPLTFLTAADSASITVRRLDTNACARLSIRAGQEGAGVPSTPPARTASVESALVAALNRLGLQLARVDSGFKSEGSYTCSKDGSTCTAQRTRISNAQYTNSLESVQVEIRLLPAAADAQRWAAERGADNSGWRTEAHRGLPMRVLDNSDYNYGDGLWQGPQTTREYATFVGSVYLYMHAQGSCDSRQDQVSSCAQPSARGIADFDVLIDEVVRAGFAPAPR